MDENSESDMNQLQTIKAAIHYVVGSICEDVGQNYGLTFNKSVIASCSEFINRQIEIYSVDLEAFAKHGRRVNINLDDVKLLARRNPALKAKLQSLAEVLEVSSSKKCRKRKSDALETVEEGSSKDAINDVS